MVERVLVVDDDETIRRTLRINLRARGYEVEEVASGRDALSTVEDAPPDLVILDLGLPDLDGVEVLRRLRRTSRVPVVVLSARHQSDDKVEALDEGADDYVTKPFGMDELMARVRSALRRGGGDGEVLGGIAPVVTDAFAIDFGTLTATRDGRAGAPHARPSGGCSVSWPGTGAGWSPRPTCSRPCGGPATAGSRTTCGSTATSCGASSRATPRGRGTSSPSPASATAWSSDALPACSPRSGAQVAAPRPPEHPTRGGRMPRSHRRRCGRPRLPSMVRRGRRARVRTASVLVTALATLLGSPAAAPTSSAAGRRGGGHLRRRRRRGPRRPRAPCWRRAPSSRWRRTASRARGAARDDLPTPGRQHLGRRGRALGAGALRRGDRLPRPVRRRVAGDRGRVHRARRRTRPCPTTARSRRAEPCDVVFWAYAAFITVGLAFCVAMGLMLR